MTYFTALIAIAGLAFIAVSVSPILALGIVVIAAVGAFLDSVVFGDDE